MVIHPCDGKLCNYLKRAGQGGQNSLAVQCLGLGAFTAMARVQSLVRELRSCKPHRTTPQEKGGGGTNISTY